VDITLEWTSTLGQHLEYNQQEKKLYIYQHPSICLLMITDGSKTLLSDIYRHQKLEHAAHQPLSNLDQLEFDGYLSEILLSYRLMFARHRRSRTSIRSKLSALGQDCDPLLTMLCTADEKCPEIQKLYKHLRDEPAHDYVPIVDFPFLAQKLCLLQKANMGCNPHSLRRLWNDRRNPAAWFALWLVLIITTWTLIFQMLQLVFQIYTPA
jgi:hypothetical protein